MYQFLFLYEADEISEREFEDAKEYIRTGLEEGKEWLSSMMSDDEVWF